MMLFTRYFIPASLAGLNSVGGIQTATTIMTGTQQKSEDN